MIRSNKYKEKVGEKQTNNDKKSGLTFRQAHLIIGMCGSIICC